MRDDEFSSMLLAWYDQNARTLPWRIGPAERKAGQIPDPYKVWLSEVMLQQTTVASVRSYFLRFVDLWPDVGALAAAADVDVMGEWAGLGYYARARNLLKCARVIESEHGGRFPETRDALLKLPGIGPYTAAAISAIAYDKRATVVDGNVERVIARLFCIETPLPAAKPELTAYADRLTPQERAGDHAQAMMDLGATICTPRNPACGICPLKKPCLANGQGRAADLPNKSAKPAKPIRYGIAYVAMRADGAFLLEQRPDKGLLGGMQGWPGTGWAEKAANPSPPVAADWRHCHDEVRHTFTHFHLRLSVQVAQLPIAAQPQRGQFIARENLRLTDLPTVMRKVFDAAKPLLQGN